MGEHPFYNYGYNWVAPPARTHLGRIVRGPWKLGELLARASGFVYIGGVGFLDTLSDGGAYELGYVRSRGKRVVSYFTGNDIRSPRLSRELEQETGEPNLGTYLVETSPSFASEAYEQRKRDIARAAETNSDVIFNADYGQRGYLTRPSEPFLYFHPDGDITDDFSKFADTAVPIVVHAPSSPIVKGTQLVRAAVTALREEGYVFEYVELVRQSNAEVLTSLERAHIVLNQFYSEVPGVFGVEALAAGCVVMMRADEHDERSLPPGSNDAWVLTRHHEVTRNLRDLLDHPERWEAQARAGTSWVRENASASVNGERLRRILGT